MRLPHSRPLVSLALGLTLAGCGGGATLAIGGSTVEVGVNTTLHLPEHGLSVSFEGVRPAGCDRLPCSADAEGVFLTLRKDGAPAGATLFGGPGASVDHADLRVTYQGLSAGAAVLLVQDRP